MESQSETLTPIADVTTKKWLEKFLLCRRWNGFTGICNPKDKSVALRFWLPRARAGPARHA
jgi:hypothetical protein